MACKCPICDSERSKCFASTILLKYEIDYFYCHSCGFLQTEEPFWIEEAYSNPIADTDTGLVARNSRISRKLACLLFYLFDKDGKYVDIAGGYGFLTRLMRDIGFNFYWSDLYCENLLAKGFEADFNESPFTAITAFEVLEHVYDPIQFITKNLSKSKTSTIIFSTLLFSETLPDPQNWWYYSKETGQHVSFYQKKTLNTIAARLSLNCFSHAGVHILTSKNFSPVFVNLTVGRMHKILFKYVANRLTSKIFVDHETMIKKLTDQSKN